MQLKNIFKEILHMNKQTSKLALNFIEQEIRLMEMEHIATECEMTTLHSVLQSVRASESELSIMPQC